MKLLYVKQLRSQGLLYCIFICIISHQTAGVSGVAVLAESHISIHTWPERDYAALDIFMCGDTQPEKAINVFEDAFETTNIEVTEYLRGKVRVLK